MDRGRAFPVSVALFLSATLILEFLGVAMAGVPLATLPFLALVVLASARKRAVGAPPLWLQTALLAALPLGLLKVADSAHLVGALKDLVQLVLILGGGWGVLALLDERGRAYAQRVLGAFAALVLALSFTLSRGGPVAEGGMSPVRLTFLLALLFPFLVAEILAADVSTRRMDVRWCWPRLLAVLGAGGLFAFAARHGGLVLCGGLGGLLVVGLPAQRARRKLLAVALTLGLVGGAILAPTGAWDALRLRRDTGEWKRLAIEYEAAPAAMAAAPWTGHGFGRYKDVIRPFFRRLPAAADNRIEPDTNSAYVLLAVEAGVVPAALLLVALLTLAAAAMRAARRDPAAAAPAGAVAVLALGALFTGFATRHTGLCAGVVLGVAAAWRPGVRPVLSGAWGARAAVCATAWAALLVALLASGRPRRAETTTGLRIVSAVATHAVADLPEGAWVAEAEGGMFAAGGPFAVVPANDTSNHAALAIPSGTGKGEGTATYTVNDMPAGEVTMWIRAFWEDGCSNSVSLTVGDEMVVLTDETYRRWHWVGALRRVHVPQGPFTLTLQRTEDGVMIDQILLSPDRTFVPHGILRQPKSNE